MRFVVTGTPRSATRYAAALFEKLDVPCTHEKLFRPQSQLVDVSRWDAHGESGESSWMAWAFLGALQTPIACFHTMRNPWAVIDSLAHRNQVIQEHAQPSEHQKRMRATIEAYCPRVFTYDAPVNRAAALVVDWNRVIAVAARRHATIYHPFHVERLTPNAVHEMLSLIGVTRDDAVVRRALENVSTRTNRGRILKHGQPLSHPGIQAYAEQLAKARGLRLTTQSVSLPEEEKAPAEIAGMMDPALCGEVNAYAERHGYETVAAVAA